MPTPLRTNPLRQEDASVSVPRHLEETLIQIPSVNNQVEGTLVVALNQGYLPGAQSCQDAQSRLRQETEVRHV